MTLHFSTRLARLLVIAAALTAVAAPAALAQPDTWYANAVAKAQSSSGTTFITDTLAPGSGSTTDVCTHAMPVSVAQAQACASPEQPTSAPVEPVTGGGFNWGILGIAIGGAFVLLLALYSGLRVRSHHRPATV
jgi:hypothetical protein